MNKKGWINFKNSGSHAIKEHAEEGLREFQRPRMGNRLVIFAALHIDDRQGWIQTKARKRQETGMGEETEEMGQEVEREDRSDHRRQKGKIPHGRDRMERAGGAWHAPPFMMAEMPRQKAGSVPCSEGHVERGPGPWGSGRVG